MNITYYDYFRAMVNTKFLRNFEDIVRVEHGGMCGSGETFKHLTRQVVRHNGYAPTMNHGDVVFYFNDGAIGYAYEGYAGKPEWKLFDPAEPCKAQPLTALLLPF